MATVKQVFKDLPSLLKATYKEWVDDEPFDLSAIVAYYSIFSIPALVIIVVHIAGAVYGQTAVEGKIAEEVGALIGQDTAAEIQQMIKDSPGKENSTISMIVGIGTLLFGATAVFNALQKSLNRLWEVKPDPQKAGIKKIIKDRATSFGIVLTIGFLLLISLVLTSALSILSDWIRERMPEFLLYLFYGLDFILSFGVITLVFAMLYRFLPDVDIQWKSVWVGAGVTALLFIGGKYALSLYFEHANPGSAYGAAGSIILMLMWMSYSCLILFFGAEFTQVYARRYGQHIQPSGHAVRRADYYQDKKKRSKAREGE
jgi:membrane protein